MWKVIKINAELHKKIKKYAEMHGKKIQWIVNQALIECLTALESGEKKNVCKS